MFSLICVWINGWVNKREAGDLRRYRVHYDVTVMNVKMTHGRVKTMKLKFNILTWSITTKMSREMLLSYIVLIFIIVSVYCRLFPLLLFIVIIIDISISFNSDVICNGTWSIIIAITIIIIIITSLYRKCCVGISIVDRVGKRQQPFKQLAPNTPLSHYEYMTAIFRDDILVNVPADRQHEPTVFDNQPGSRFTKS